MAKTFKLLGLVSDKGRTDDVTIAVTDEKNSVYTFEILKQDFIDERNSVDFAYEEEDIWKEAVRGGYTTDSLEDWYKNEIDTCGGLYPYDDYSYRDEMEECYDEASQEIKDIIAEHLGYRGEDFVTFSCVSIGAFESEDYLEVFDTESFEKLKKKEEERNKLHFCSRCGRQVEKNEPMYYSHEGYGHVCSECDVELDRQEAEERKARLVDEVFTLFTNTSEKELKALLNKLESYQLIMLKDGLNHE